MDADAPSEPAAEGAAARVDAAPRGGPALPFLQIPGLNLNLHPVALHPAPFEDPFDRRRRVSFERAERRRQWAEVRADGAALGAPPIDAGSSTASTSSSPRLFAGRSRTRAESRGESISDRGPIAVPRIPLLNPDDFIPERFRLDIPRRRPLLLDDEAVGFNMNFIWQLMAVNDARTADLQEPDSPPPPEVDAHDSCSAVGERADNGCAIGTLHLLVVDDVQLFRSICGRFLNRLGCTFVVLEDGDVVEAAVADAVAAGKPYDGILLDIHMPRTSGVLVCAALRAKAFHLPIIAMTSSTSDKEKTTYYDAGFDVVLPKPFTQDGVRSALQEALARQRDSRASIPRDPPRQVLSPSGPSLSTSPQSGL